MNYQDLFNSMYPGFFESAGIRSIPPEHIYEEQILDLHTFSPAAVPLTCPEHITFRLYQGNMDALHDAIRKVNENWVQYFNPDAEIYCALDGEKIASFCRLNNWGSHQGLRIGAPGAVGTVPDYRGQGIGLKMIQNVTALLKERGYDLSYIHYTHVGHWYAKLGYQTVLRWNSQGIIG